MMIKRLFENKSLSKIISLAVSVYTFCCLIFYIIYGAMYDYFDVVALLMCLFGIASAVCYFFLDFNSRMAKTIVAALGILAVACFSATFAIIIVNSIYVWADVLNNITMFGSRGGLAPVITLIILFGMAIVAQIIACFLGSEKQKNNN